jgi:phage FluMu protein Com
MKTVEILESNYEVIKVKCPVCKGVNTFNRRSDLGTLDIISNMTVQCQKLSCNQKFIIIGDSVSALHRSMIFDCYNLLDQKRYTLCVLSLTQAFEIFFSSYIRNVIVIEPYRNDYFDLENLKTLNSLLILKIKNFCFSDLRNIFLNILIQEFHSSSLESSKRLISKFSDSELKKDPPDLSIRNLNNQSLSHLLMKLKKSTIATLRNNIIHKNAYLPSEEEAKNVFKGTKEIIFGLERELNLYKGRLILL